MACKLISTFESSPERRCQYLKIWMNDCWRGVIESQEVVYDICFSCGQGQKAEVRGLLLMYEGGRQVWLDGPFRELLV